MTQGITTRNLLFAGAIGVAFLMSGACAESGKDEQKDDAEPPAVTERPGPMSREERLAARQKLEETRQVTASPMTELSAEPATSGVTGEVPDDLLDRIFADLEKQTGAKRSEFKVLQAEATQWNDGALGCPEPGQVYTQAIVDGYRVVIEYKGETFDYRTSAGGFFKLCKQFRPNRKQDLPNM